MTDELDSMTGTDDSTDGLDDETMTDETESQDETESTGPPSTELNEKRVDEQPRTSTDAPGTDGETPLSRRAALSGIGLAGLLGLGTVGTATADPRGQVGTAQDPLQTLYTEELNGGLTGDRAVTTLAGDGLRVSGGALTVDGDAYLSVSGDTMAGNLSMGANSITDADSVGVTSIVGNGSNISVEDTLDVNANSITDVGSLGVTSIVGNGSSISVEDALDVNANSITDVDSLGVTSIVGNGSSIDVEDTLDVNARTDIREEIDSSGVGDPAEDVPFFVANQDSTSEHAIMAIKSGYAGDPQSGHSFIQFGSADGSGGVEGHGVFQGDGSGGITFETFGADYAEWLPRLDPDEDIDGGDVVGVVGNAVTKRTDGAARVLVVSEAPNVVGNAPDAETKDAYEPVAFTGQVPVAVRGTVEDGDLLVPSGDHDGTAVAVAPAERRPGTPVIGQAWEATDEEGTSEVTVAVGIDDPAVVGESMEARISRQADRIAELESETERLAAENEQLREQNAALEARLEAIEAHLGLDSTPGGQGIADD